MAKDNTVNGKAFEYACLVAVRDVVTKAGGEVVWEKSKPLNTAEKCLSELGVEDRHKYLVAAMAGIEMVSRLEPKLALGKGALTVEILADASGKGSEGDVRDIRCIRKGDKTRGVPWEIGLSCKHNHEALRHPRITKEKDFGKDWMDKPCSKEFIDTVTPIVDTLSQYEEKKVKWVDVPNKWENYYEPLVKAHLKEIRRMCDADDTVPKALLSYFFGSKDFYKVIMRESWEATVIEGFNTRGTMNKKQGDVKPLAKMNKLTFPKRLLHSEAKVGDEGVNTLVLTFDESWVVSMRLHNKDSIAKPTSLAWDVQLEGFPKGMFDILCPWSDQIIY